MQSEAFHGRIKTVQVREGSEVVLNEGDRIIRVQSETTGRGETWHYLTLLRAEGQEGGGCD